jgi:hypothetical protein
MRGMRICQFLVILLVVLPFYGVGHTYTIDGNVGDWGINLSQAIKGATTQAVYPNTTFSHNGYLDTHLPTSPTANYVTEDNADKSSPANTYVGPGYTAGNRYDAEAMYFDNSSTRGYIAIISGLPYNDILYPPGDIGLDVNSGTAKIMDTNPAGLTGAMSPYEYGIQIVYNSAKNTYSGLLGVVDVWKQVYYDGSPQPDYSVAGPWRINDFLGTPISIPLAYGYDPAGQHYVIETSFLLSDLGLVPGDDLGIHWTMRCGNDVLNLTANVNPIPEPATMLLIGSGLIGLAVGFRRKFLGGASERGAKKPLVEGC